ncbi:MAG: hypothetical protein ACON5F_01155 [Jejuia sp.]
MKSKKIIFVVPDGTGIRNYLFSQIIPLLVQEGHKFLLYHALSEKAIKEIENLYGFTIEHKSIPIYRETFFQKFFRESICFARLLHNTKLEGNETILTNWKRNHGGIKQLFYKCAEFFGYYLHLKYPRILNAEKRYQKLLVDSLKPEKEFLSSYEPDVIFCTHQRAVKAIPVFKAASELGIKTITAIYSWDNLVKARLAIRSNNYIVWSDYMKKELQRYYPEIKSNQILTTGTPQFCLYKRANLLSKAKFFSLYDLDYDKFTICFSGDDELTSPYDPRYLEDLAVCITEHNLDQKVQIIFRRCPVDISSRYDDVLKKYEVLITPITPKWSNTDEDWTQLFPYFEDVDLLANICRYSDLVVNIGSTMAHDFTYFDNPAAFINYDVTFDENWSVNTIYAYQHFRSMPTKDAVLWVNSPEDYIKIIRDLNQHKVVPGKDWFKRINHEDMDSEKKIAKILVT